jgi:hypothetical protein
MLSLNKQDIDYVCHVVLISPFLYRMSPVFKLMYVQDRQCTYNVMLRRVLFTIVAMEKQ